MVKFLVELRKSRNMTRPEMAKMLDISESLYTKIEYGLRNPSSQFMQKFKSKFPEYDMNIFFTSKLHETCREKTTAKRKAV